MITTISITIILGYLVHIGLLTYGFDKVKQFNLRDLPSTTYFSIVIPFRNEAQNLEVLLASINNLNYPKSLFEVILVNDASKDNSEQIINSYLINSTVKLHVIDNIWLSNSPKKDAINTAITIAKYEWIITTDADCILPEYWLDTFDEYIQSNNVECIAAPVSYADTDSFFKRFQALDFLSLQGATIGGFGLKNPFMCNGANFAYRKSAFKNLKGFEGNQNIASGDDIFLLYKFLKTDKRKVQYLKSKQAVVTTKPAGSLNDLIMQRLRWASKMTSINNTYASLTGLTVLLANLTLITIIPLFVLDIIDKRTACALVVIKFGADFLLLFKTTRFYRQETLLLSYLISSLIYPFFNVYVALLSLFQSYEWKGRTFKK